MTDLQCPAEPRKHPWTRGRNSPPKVTFGYRVDLPGGDPYRGYAFHTPPSSAMLTLRLAAI